MERTRPGRTRTGEPGQGEPGWGEPGQGEPGWSMVNPDGQPWSTRMVNPDSSQTPASQGALPWQCFEASFAVLGIPGGRPPDKGPDTETESTIRFVGFF